MNRFSSEQECVSAWSGQYRNLASKTEYAAFVYTSDKRGYGTYYTGKTYKGMGAHGPIRANVVIAFLFMYLFESLFYKLLFRASVSAFIHTHPQPMPGYTSRHHSPEDLFLLRLPRIRAVYVVPFENNEINCARR